MEVIKQLTKWHWSENEMICIYYMILNHYIIILLYNINVWWSHVLYIYIWIYIKCLNSASHV